MTFDTPFVRRPTKPAPLTDYPALSAFNSATRVRGSLRRLLPTSGSDFSAGAGLVE